MLDVVVREVLVLVMVDVVVNVTVVELVPRMDRNKPNQRNVEQQQLTLYYRKLPRSEIEPGSPLGFSLLNYRLEPTEKRFRFHSWCLRS